MTRFYLTVTVALLVWVPISAGSQGTGSKSVPSKSKSQKPGNAVTVRMDLSDAVTGFLIGCVGGPNDPRYWTVFDETRSYEAEFETNDELIRYYQKQPEKRKRKGIIIWNSLTHLKDAKASGAKMTDYEKKLLKNSKWLRDQQAFVAKLTESCRVNSITLWINTDLGAKDVEFIQLTQPE